MDDKILRQENDQFVHKDYVTFVENVGFGYTESVGDSIPSADVPLTVTINGVDAISLPAGTTLERPDGASINLPMIRFNTTLGEMELYTPSSGSWGSVGGGGDILYDNSTPMPQDLGGLLAGSTFDNLPITDLFDSLLYPVLYPALTIPSVINNTTVNSYYEIASLISFEVESIFNRGGITPDYNTSYPYTNGYRSGLPNVHSFASSDPAMGIFDINTTDLVTSADIVNYDVISGVINIVTSVGYSVGTQPVDSSLNNYESPYPAGSTPNRTITFEGVYPIFATTSTITVLNKQSLDTMVSPVNLEYVLVPETIADKQKIDIPNGWSVPLLGIKQLNTLSNVFEYPGGTAAASLTWWDITPTTHSIQSVSIGYSRYTYNGATRGAVEVQLVFAN